MMHNTIDYKAGYINGLLDSMCTKSSSLGVSFISAIVVGRKELTSVLGDLCSLSEIEFELIPSEHALEDMLLQYVGKSENDRDLVESFERFLQFEFGECQSVASFLNEQAICKCLSGYAGGEGPFYITEALFVAFFDELAVVFIVGNDE